MLYKQVNLVASKFLSPQELLLQASAAARKPPLRYVQLDLSFSPPYSIGEKKKNSSEHFVPLQAPKSLKRLWKEQEVTIKTKLLFI